MENGGFAFKFTGLAWPSLIVLGCSRPGMEKVRISDVDNDVQPAAVRRRLAGPLGLTDMAINYYELEPGDSFGFAYHRHGDQEEVFYVRAGTATFETEGGEVEVGPRELVRFAPGEFQRGWNYGDDRVVALALGAPRSYEELTMLRECPDCGDRTEATLERREEDGERVAVAYCVDCGEETGRWTRGPSAGEVS